jgi:two-component system sensor histidine kinase/response regulator
MDARARSVGAAVTNGPRSLVSRQMTDTADTASPLILVADDVPANVELLFDQLDTLGFRTVAAYDGPTAVEAAFRHRPDLCILDVSMPAGSLGVDDRSTGFEVCRRIKRDPRTARIPVIFVTALNDTTDRVKAIEAGGDDFLTKPHNRLVLGARVRSLLKLKAATDALEASYLRLRNLEKLRDDLMKMIVHDLKTPLTSMVATLEMLDDGDFGAVTDSQRQAIGDCSGRADELLRLIEDLLEVARLEETTMQLSTSALEPAAFLHDIVDEWALRFRQAGATVAVDVAPGTPRIEADRSLVHRVMGNLLQNAVTHANRAVALRLTARPQDEGVLFTVADNGPGIPAEFHDVIFRKFERVRTPALAHGSGLGLAFCKLAVEAHGGRIWVQSRQGEGAQFHFILPLRPVSRSGDTPRG